MSFRPGAMFIVLSSLILVVVTLLAFKSGVGIGYRPVEDITPSSFRAPALDNTVKDSKTGEAYAAGEILVVSKNNSGSSQELFEQDIEKIVSEELNGQVVGSIIESGIFQVEFSGENENLFERSIKKLEKYEEIDAVLPNYKQTLNNYEDKWTQHQERFWGQKLINLHKAWEVTKGSDDIGVGVIDYAYSTAHPDLEGAKFVAPGGSLHNNDDWSDLPGRYTDHGTGVASVVQGVMREADLTCYGTYFLSDRVEAILDAIRRDIRVVNISMGPIWGRAGNTDNYSEQVKKRKELFWRPILQKAYKNDLLIVHAAGNNHQIDSTKIPPASLSAEFDNLISVSAINKNLDRIFVSGNSIDVSAPGSNIWAGRTYYGVWDGFSEPYDFSSGTSYSAPFVTGVAGLMLSVNPDLKPKEIKEIIVDTSFIPEDLDYEKELESELESKSEWDYNWGSGIIDAGAAVKAVKDQINN
ncbi:S8 family serine peptidase [Natranaerofaba carboxydovora]|uniref:S8 family serine peptidase n=1 Tax=Natranaerofaba carboxydovora TaxID=2742683 RepID=UPI001F13E470|nr:S8 family serine peptidase [Natranaerofaba carboxydovora]UMZ72754.1 Thermophilic serine proteinase [Natranaerofaba carboxydovora]